MYGGRAAKYIVDPGPWTSHTRSFVRPPLLKNRREGEQLALRQSARTYRRKSTRVVRYLTTPLPRRAPRAAAALSRMSLPLLSISLRCLLSLSLLLCFGDLFVSASRPIFIFFFFFSPAYLSPPSSRKESSASRAVPSRAHESAGASDLANFVLSRERERVRERGMGEITATSHLHARVHLLSSSFAPKSSVLVNRPR